MSKLQIPVLKVVGTCNFEAQKIGVRSQRFDILCRNDESRDLTETRFNFCQRMV